MSQLSFLQQVAKVISYANRSSIAIHSKCFSKQGNIHVTTHSSSILVRESWYAWFETHALSCRKALLIVKENNGRLKWRVELWNYLEPHEDGGKWITDTPSLREICWASRAPPVSDNCYRWAEILDMNWKTSNTQFEKLQFSRQICWRVFWT